MDIKDTTTNPLATGDVVAHNKVGRIRLIEALGEGRWTGEWLSGKHAGKTKEITISSDAKSPRVEMAPREDAQVEPAAEVEPVAVVDAQDPHTRAECDDLDTCGQDHLPEAPAPAEKPVRDRGTRAASARKSKRAPLPEGMVTVAELAKAIMDAGEYHGKAAKGLSADQIHWYAVRSTQDNPWPGVEIEGRKAVDLEAGIAWWIRKETATGRRTTSDAQTA